MSIVMNEVEWVEDLMAHRNLGRYKQSALKRVARYMYFVYGYRCRKLREELEKFLTRCDPDISIGFWHKKLDRIAKGAGKYPLIEVSEVSVTESEMAAINGLGGRQSKRIAFTLLCLAKFWNAVKPGNDSWVKTRDTEIMKMANVSASSCKCDYMLHDMKEAGLLSFKPHITDLSIKVNFIEQNSPVVFNIIDFRNLGHQYHMFHGEPFIQCRECGLTVRKMSNSQKYCAGCAVDINIKKSVDAAMQLNYAKSTV